MKAYLLTDSGVRIPVIVKSVTYKDTARPAFVTIYISALCYSMFGYKHATRHNVNPDTVFPRHHVRKKHGKNYWTTKPVVWNLQPVTQLKG